MKSKFKMPARISYVLIMITLSVSILNKAKAQPNFMPATLPQTLVQPFGATMPNSAMIEYTPNCTNPSGCGISQLKVITAVSNAGPFVYVDDGLPGTSITISLPANAEAPAVVVANNTNTSTDYLIGVVYYAAGTTSLDIYNIHNVGTGGILIPTYVSTQVISTASPLSYPRIDIIAEYGNPFLSYPRCDRFVIAYTETIGSGTSINGYWSSLNNPTVTQTSTIASIPGTFFGFPDVAAIQRKIGPDVHDIAIFVYSDAVPFPSQSIYYQEWDITIPAVSASTVLLSNNNTGHARIAAIDDFNINDPSIISPLAYYTASVLTTDPATFNKGMMIFNNLGASGGIEIAQMLTGTPSSMNEPGITAGPCDQYTIQYTPGVGGFSEVVAQNIKWASGVPTGGYPTAMDYYQMNDVYKNSGNVLAASPSATCNGISPQYAQYLLAPMDLFEPVFSELYEKTTDCNMAFKTTKVANIRKGEWSIAPNPAIDNIVLANDNAMQGYTYSVTDIMGRQLLYDGITSAKQSIDVSPLAPGIYLLNVYSNNQAVKTIKFVKE